MKNTNEIETIIDPFLGTGGLLIESYKMLISPKLSLK